MKSVPATAFLAPGESITSDSSNAFTAAERAVECPRDVQVDEPHSIPDVLLLSSANENFAEKVRVEYITEPNATFPASRWDALNGARAMAYGFAIVAPFWTLVCLLIWVLH